MTDPAQHVASRVWVTVLFAITILLSSALLFVVEPLVVKMMLPGLGGASAVWNTSLVFFQLMLLAGYAWSHFASTQLGLARLVMVQMALVVGAVFALPVAMPLDWVPDARAPVTWTLMALTMVVGLPFFALTTISPMLQRWYSHTVQDGAADPYFLYSASNAGSLMGLLAYPWIIEPRWSLQEQSEIWGSLFGLLALLIALSGLAAWTLRQRDGAVVERRDVEAPPQHGKQRLRWVALAAIPSALMLGVTHHLTTDIASLPMIWVVPLALYLLSFMVTFGAKPRWLDTAAGYTLKLSVLPLALTLFGFAPIELDLLLGLVVFFAAALLAHGALADSRPSVGLLTEFYFLVSLGGALGGTLIAVLAPQVFPVVLEYPLAVAAALLVIPKRAFSAGRVMDTRVRSALGVGAIATVSVLVLLLAPDESASAMAIAATAGVGIYVAARRRPEFAFGMGMLLVVVPVYSVPQALYVDRSFFGTLRVSDVGGFREIMSGSTVHGSQSLDPRWASRPTTYYHRNGPVGDLFNLREADAPQSVAVVGLGVGSVAAYGRSIDRHLYLEIDPLVAELAQDPRYFTYLRDSPAQIEIRIGDGRLQLEATDEKFDLLVLDAFTSDAIPIHMMTLEAMKSYGDRLEEGGVLAYHVSNRHAELRPVLAMQAKELGLALVAIEDAVSDQDAATGKWRATWVAVARSRKTLDALGPRWSEVASDGVPLWTDTYSNLVQALHFW